MLAGGTGITPMLQVYLVFQQQKLLLYNIMFQVIKEILKNPDDKTDVTLVFANHAEVN